MPRRWAKTAVRSAVMRWPARSAPRRMVPARRRFRPTPLHWAAKRWRPTIRPSLRVSAVPRPMSVALPSVATANRPAACRLHWAMARSRRAITALPSVPLRWPPVPARSPLANSAKPLAMRAWPSAAARSSGSSRHGPPARAQRHSVPVPGPRRTTPLPSAGIPMRTASMPARWARAQRRLPTTPWRWVAAAALMQSVPVWSVWMPRPPASTAPASVVR